MLDGFMAISHTDWTLLQFGWTKQLVNWSTEYKIHLEKWSDQYDRVLNSFTL